MLYIFINRIDIINNHIMLGLGNIIVMLFQLFLLCDFNNINYIDYMLL